LSAETRFERVVLPHLNAAYTLARYLTRDVSEAEDATQEAILRAVRYFGTLRSEDGARAWLLAIVRRECHGRRQPQVSTVSYDEVPELQLVDPNAQTDT
jgi:DNA-directed RNA polymerase specialized sigma24 family protein